MRYLFRSVAVMSLILLVPIVPFLLLGTVLESWVDSWTSRQLSTTAAMALIVALLATDIFLPVPSSLISTMGGWKLGWFLGTLTSTVGMTLGAFIGFVLAVRWGRPLAVRLSSEVEMARMQRLSERYGAVVLVMTRGVPVLAEASVLLVGVHRMSWRGFLPPVILSNLGIAWAYSAFGDFAEQNQWLPLALGVAIALPVLLATFARVLIFRESPSD